MSVLQSAARLSRRNEWAWPGATTLGVVVVGFAAITVLAADYRLPVLMTALIYGVLLVGMDVQIGYGNQLALSQPAFMAIGAYSTAAVTTRYGWTPFAGLLVGLVITLVVGYLVARCVLRVSGMALTLVSLFLLLISTELLSVTTWLGASNGISGIVPIAIGTKSFGDPLDFSYIVLAVLALTVLAAARFVNSGTGLEVHVVAADEPVARSMGISVRRRKLQVFLFGCVTADIAGFLFAHGTGYVSPTQFDVSFALILVLMFFLGGRRSIVGGLLGAIILEFLPTFSETVANNLLIIEGVTLTIVLILAREGLVGLATALVRRLGRGAAAVAPPPGRRTAEPPATGTRAHGLSLRTEDTAKRFGGVTAVDGISLTVPDHGILPIVGPNGAGKTTYFALVSGLLAADRGTMTLGEQDITGLRDWQRARLGISRTFQLVRLPPSLTVLDNVAAGSHLSNGTGMLRTYLRSDLVRARARAAATLDALGIGHLADHRPHKLTLANQRFVELARVLASDPQLILLDEPASGLSDEQRQQLAELLLEISSTVPVLLIEHDLDFIAKVADDVVVLALGTLIYQGPLSGLAEDPVVAEAYLGATPSSVAATASSGP